MNSIEDLEECWSTANSVHSSSGVVKSNVGELAFPVGAHHNYSGMSLRDWFAGQVLSGLVVGRCASSLEADNYARMAYALADEMLMIRKG